MKKITLQFLLFCCLSVSAYGQWQPSAGTAGLNMQSLLTNGIYNLQEDKRELTFPLIVPQIIHYQIPEMTILVLQEVLQRITIISILAQVKVLLEALTMEQLGFLKVLD